MFKQHIGRLFKPGNVTVLGLVGQAGAGKTNHVAPILQRNIEELKIYSQKLGLDSFFYLSSQERKQWLKDGWKISQEEGLRRENQINWWNFNKMEESISVLRQNKPLHLKNVYNRKDRGELTGEVIISPGENGMFLLLEGVALAHLEYVDEIWYVHSPDETRFKRLFSRDSDRRDMSKEAKKRWEITQRFEKEYYSLYWEKINLVITNSGDKNEPPQLLENFPNYSQLF